MTESKLKKANELYLSIGDTKNDIKALQEIIGTCRPVKIKDEMNHDRAEIILYKQEEKEMLFEPILDHFKAKLMKLEDEFSAL
jgi:soluble P-type ATPase